MSSQPSESNFSPDICGIAREKAQESRLALMGWGSDYSTAVDDTGKSKGRMVITTADVSQGGAKQRLADPCLHLSDSSLGPRRRFAGIAAK